MEEYRLYVATLAGRIVGSLVGIVTDATKRAVTSALEGRLDKLLKNRQSDSRIELQEAIINSLKENGIPIREEHVQKAISATVSEYALVINASGPGTTGRILKNGATETIYGSQQVNVSGGATGEVISGGHKTIISEGGSAPGLSVTVDGSGTGMTVHSWIDENGKQHGGLSVTKIIE